MNRPIRPATLATTRLAEHWAHGLDITVPLGISFPDTGRLRHVAWLAHRSLATLDVRLERGEANALALAELLEGRVEGLRYPGLPSDPAHELAGRQMSRFGTVLCFDLGSLERAQGFLGAAQLVTEATSFGGVLTTAERRGRWGGDDVPEGFIRLSAGCEATDDLVADVEQALATA